MGFGIHYTRNLQVPSLQVGCSDFTRIRGHHDDVIKWKHFPYCWPFVWGIHRSPVNSPQKGQWRETLMISFICVWINGWVNNREADDMRRYRACYDVTVMTTIVVAIMTDRQHTTFPDVPYGVLQGAALCNGYSPIWLTCPAIINHRGHEHQCTLQSTFMKHSRAEFL